MILSGADIVIEVLLEQECDVIFGYPGAQVIAVSYTHLTLPTMAVV